MFVKLASKLAALFAVDVKPHIAQPHASKRRADLEPHGRFYEANHNPFAFYEESYRN